MPREGIEKVPHQQVSRRWGPCRAAGAVSGPSRIHSPTPGYAWRRIFHTEARPHHAAHLLPSLPEVEEISFDLLERPHRIAFPQALDPPAGLGEFLRQGRSAAPCHGAIAPRGGGAADSGWAVSGPSEVHRSRPTATDSDSRATTASGDAPGHRPPTERVSPEGWRSGKMGCICPLQNSSCRTVSLG